MADTIDIPGFGKTKKQTAYVVGAGLVLIGGVAWYRSRNAGPSPDAAAAAASDIDPATGFAYGSAEDANALAGQSNSWSGSGGGDGPVPSPGVPTAGSYATNGQWSQAAEDYLVNTVQMDANTAGNALGKYIAGQPMTTDQISIAEQAIAFTGFPPVAGPSGYPPSYRTAATPPTPAKPAAPKGLKYTAVGKSTVALTWTKSAGAASYRVYDNHSSTNVGASVDNTVQIGDLDHNTSYKFHVRALGPTGVQSDASSTITVHTKK